MHGRRTIARGLAAPLLALALFPALAACDAAQVRAESAGHASSQLALLGRVSDHAQILPEASEKNLSTRLEALERRTHHQLVIVTVPSLGGREISHYSLDLANRWGIGRKGYNDGVMILLAPNERKVRIEVGYGLEKQLSDDLCDEIIQEEMLPRFRENDYPGGIEAGAAAIDRALT